MLCACIEGTVYFDHDARKWKSSDHRCANPEPRHPSTPRPEPTAPVEAPPKRAFVRSGSRPHRRG